MQTPLSPLPLTTPAESNKRLPLTPLALAAFFVALSRCSPDIQLAHV